MMHPCHILILSVNYRGATLKCTGGAHPHRVHSLPRRASRLPCCGCFSLNYLATTAQQAPLSMGPLSICPLLVSSLQFLILG